MSSSFSTSPQRSLPEPLGRDSSEYSGEGAGGDTRNGRGPLLACIGSGTNSERVIRAAAAMGAALPGKRITLHVRAPATSSSGSRDQRLVNDHLRLARDLGAEVVLIDSPNVALAIIDFAQARGVGKILLGHGGARRQSLFRRSGIAADIIARRGAIEVHPVPEPEERSLDRASSALHRRSLFFAYGGALALTACATALAHLLGLQKLSDANVIMTYLVGIVFIAWRWGRGAAVAASVISVLQYNFFFTTPHYTFVVDDTATIYDFLVMFLVAMVISTLTARIQAQAQTEALYRVSRRLSGVTGTLRIAAAAERALEDMLSGKVAIVLAERSALAFSEHHGKRLFDAPNELDAAMWAFEHRMVSGAGADSYCDAAALYLPLVRPEGAFGVLAWRPERRQDALRIEQRKLVESLAHQISLILERDALTRETQRVQTQIETEKLRNALLSSVSHDLRTPLAAIAGSAGVLIENGDDPRQRRELLGTIRGEAARMARLVENLLTMTRAEAATMDMKKESQPIDEVIGTALRRVAGQLEGRTVDVVVDGNAPPVPIDGLLIEQVLVNLLENAARYSPAGSPLRVDARFRKDAGGVTVTVSDRGCGIDAAEREKIFEKFYRGPAARKHKGGGAGLGLAICRAIIAAHGGAIRVERNEHGGSDFSFSLPLNADLTGEAKNAATS